MGVKKIEMWLMVMKCSLERQKNIFQNLKIVVVYIGTMNRQKRIKELDETLQTACISCQ